MRSLLKVHPDSPRFATTQIEVEVEHPRADRLVLSYIVTGNIRDLRMPPIMDAARADKLWQHTCFEAFVRASSGDEYYEFNFAPSTQWAAYRFSSYRRGMSVASEISAAPIDVRSNSTCCTLQTSLQLEQLSYLPHIGTWHLGMSAVIEDTSGRRSYWALAHPPGKPDFHRADCFTHEFFPGEQP